MRKIYITLLSAFLFFQLQAQYAHQNIDLLGNFDDPSVQDEPVYGIRYQSCWGWVDPDDNHEYGIIGSTAGTYIIDVTDPINPIQRDYVPHRQNDCIWHEYKTYGKYLYIISDDGGSPTNSLQIADLSYLPDSVHILYDDTTVFVHAHTQYIDGNHWYVASVARRNQVYYPMAVYSLANPLAPVLLRSLSQDYPNISSVHDMFVINDTIYASCAYDGLNIYKYDSVTNHFIQLGSMPGDPNDYNHSSFISRDRSTLYMCIEVPDGRPVHIVDVSDISNPSVISTFATNAGDTPHNPYVIGDVMVLAAYLDGVYMYDVSQPQNPQYIGYFDSHPQNGTSYSGLAYMGAWAAYTDLPSGNLLISDMQYGLFVLDASLAMSAANNKPVAANGISLYPNPVHDQVNLVPEKTVHGNVIAELFSLDGRVVFRQEYDLSSERMISIDTRLFPSGMYQLALQTESGTYFNKVSVLK